MGRKSAQLRLITALAVALILSTASADIGDERSSYRRLEDGQEYTIGTRELIHHGEAAFRAQWT